MGTTLQDFSAFASNRTTWPASLAARGLRLVVASDHTLNRLYPRAFVDSLNYEDLHVPLLERDAFVYRKARQWLDDPSIDVLILHIVGTDKVSHEYPVRGPVYREKYREVDDFVREVAGRLRSETDYLFAISDHGHNELGGHTEDAGYVAHGPLFPPAVRAGLDAEDMLFLLSVPYGLLMPADYEGQVRLDLTQLPLDAAQRWMTAQANSWRVPVAGLALDQAQLRLNQEVARRSTELKRASVIESAERSAPWWFAAGLFLLGALLLQGESRLGAGKFRAVPFIALGLGLLALLGVVTFWLLPAELTWLHDESHRRNAFSAFYTLAAALGFAWTRFRRPLSAREVVLEMLWVVGIAVWLFGFFGPLGYSLMRHGSLIVLISFPVVAVIVAGGFRALWSIPTLFLPALLPIVCYDVESYNLKYLFTDPIPTLPVVAQIAIGLAAVALYVVAFHWEKWRGGFKTAVLVVAWAVVGVAFFGFEVSKLIGGLLACVWFAGCLHLFRQTRLPLRWFALVSAVFLFVLLTFFLNGFALSHVDFRFAANKIFPFAKEAWRAPQLIVWAMLKYAFALFPALAVAQKFSAGGRLWSQLLLAGWWRELTVAASALGLAIFNARGMWDLCSEEIYFWTFLNLVFLGAGLVFSRRLTAAWEAART